MEIGTTRLKVQDRAEHMAQFLINQPALQTIMLDLHQSCSTFNKKHHRTLKASCEGKQRNQGCVSTKSILSVSNPRRFYGTAGVGQNHMTL